MKFMKAGTWPNRNQLQKQGQEQTLESQKYNTFLPNQYDLHTFEEQSVKTCWREVSK
jgi:hypothetical protein